jgi:fatty-acyl-CoA synthase
LPADGFIPATAAASGWLRRNRDRLKDVIISGGENISSVEVEGVLLRHPAEEVAIVGFPNEQWGEAPHAFIVLHGGAHADERELRDLRKPRAL